MLGSIRASIRLPKKHTDRGKQDLQELSKSMPICYHSATEHGAMG